MKVTIMTLEYPPNVYGGVGVHVENMVKHLRKFVSVEVRTLDAQRKNDVREYPMWEYFDDKYPWDRVLGALSLDLAMAREPTGEIVHIHTWYANLAGFLAKKLHGSRLVSTVHSLEPLRPWKREQIGNGYNLSLWMEETGLKNSDGIIAVSREMKRDIMRVYGIDERKIEVIYNGIDTEKFRPVKTRNFIDSLGIDEGYVLFVGRLTRQKGIDTIVKASPTINARIVLVTGKEDSKETYEYYRKLLSGKENIVWIHRHLSPEQLVELYSHAAVFIAPSIYEPFGIINLEAMACETPVVSSRVGGIKEIVRDGVDGYLIEPGNADELAERVNSLLEDETLRQEMGRNGRLRAQEFSWEEIARRTYEFYRRILDEGV